MARLRLSRLAGLLPPLAVTAGSLFSLQPLLRRQMTCSDDGLFHIHKALGLELLLQRGYWFPRWSPEMAHGFGYPLYNFYAPLGSYLLAGLHAAGFIYPAALHIALGLSLWLGALALFALARDWWGQAAGVAAAVVYVTAPYYAFDALFRGALAETLAWVWPPLILLGLERSLRGPAPPFRWAALAAVCFAALLLTHNAAALVVSPLLATYAALRAAQARSWRAAAWAAGILACGLALSAYFWLPALAERDLVQTDRLLVPPIFTYYTNFLTPAELLAVPRAADPLLVNPSPPKALGLAAALLALAGLGALARREVRARDWPRPAFLGLALLIYSALTLPLSRPLWDSLPLLPFVQFPWRMLMPAALCAALLAGAAVWGWTLPRQQGARPWLAAGFVATLAVAGHLSWWYPRYCAPFVEETLARMLQYEFDTFTVGTSAKGEFLPRTVPALPDDDSLARALQQGAPPGRLAGLPEDTLAQVLDRDPLRYEVALYSDHAFPLTYRMFYYPGWTAEIDGRPARLRPTADYGLIQFDVPAGEHTIVIRFGSTPLRTTAGWLSGSAAAGIAIALAADLRSRPAANPGGQRRRKARASSQRTAAPAVLPASAWPQAACASLLLALFGLKMFWVDQADSFLRNSRFDGATLSTGRALSLDLDGGLRLLAYERPDRAFSGGEFDAVLYLAQREGGALGDFQPVFSLLDAAGTVWNNPKDALPPRWHREPPPPYEWPMGHYAQWARRDVVLPGTPPGRYRLTAGVFDRATLLPLSVLDENGSPLTPKIDLGEIVVERPPTPARLDQLVIEYPAGRALAAGLTLLGYNLDRVEAQPGDTMLVTLFWQAEAAPGSDLLALLTLLDPSGSPAFQSEFSPASAAYPTSLWQAGDVWRGHHLLHLPPGLPAGNYTWRLSLGAEAAPLGRLNLTAPERQYDRPQALTDAGAQFGDFATLAGYLLQPAEARPGSRLTLDLVWLARATPNLRYRAFVHFADAAGRTWAQSDAEPAAWTRPTTGWLPGEYVTDTHALDLPPDLPPGEYTLAAGLAEVETGRRAPAAGPGALADGRALIARIRVEP